uniref:2-oxoacid dehydrogenase acyltransferase catalytic domain-containing protein n=1 Tax=Acrobeloides nanus TaxID=290746 RepID=A0A914C643_9BILA
MASVTTPFDMQIRIVHKLDPSNQLTLSEYRVALSKMRSEAKSYIPHYSLEAELDVGKLLKLRSELISKLKAQHNADKVPKMTINDFIIKASALACMKVPEVNSSFMDDSIRKHDYVNISFAVDTKSRDLILSPVICNAHEKGLFQISTEVGMLINKARAGKCQPDEIHGGTFSISNLGMVGSLKNFASIVYPPQAAVIAIGGIQKTLVPTDDNKLIILMRH